MAANISGIQQMDHNLRCISMSSPWPSPQDCFRNVKISRALEPFLPSGGGVGVGFGEGEGVDDGVGEGCGVEVPP